jgi:NadR type nicotinamide-nucleotide adenylyltransferase
MNNLLKKIVVIGPESTGKSTLTKGLAEEFGEPWVPEYAREYLEKLNRTYEYEDLLEIAKGQIALESDAERKAEKFLFCDTNLHVIDVWSQHKFGKTDPWITKTLQEKHYDFYLLTDIDMPWQYDPQREHPAPEMRRHFFSLYEKIVRESGVPFDVFSGNEKKRLESAKKKIENRFFF